MPATFDEDRTAIKSVITARISNKKEGFETDKLEEWNLPSIKDIFEGKYRIKVCFIKIWLFCEILSVTFRTTFYSVQAIRYA